MDKIAAELVKIARELVGGKISRSKHREVTSLYSKIRHIRNSRHWSGGDYDDVSAEEEKLNKELKRELGGGKVMSSSYAIDIYSNGFDEVEKMAEMDEYELSEYLTDKLGKMIFIVNAI